MSPLSPVPASPRASGNCPNCGRAHCVVCPPSVASGTPKRGKGEAADFVLYLIHHPVGFDSGCKLLDRLQEWEEMSPAPAAPGVDKLRYGPTADQMHTLRTAFQNEQSGRVPDGFRRTVENVLTEVFQAGLHHESVRALVDAAVNKARRDFAAEVRTRLVATDPVGLTTGPLFDWLTKEMGT